MDVELAHILHRLVFFQRRAYHQNEYTARKKRRIVSGIRESNRYISKAKAVILTADIEDSVLRSLECIQLFRACKEKQVEVIWTGLSQGELGTILYNHRVKVCCVSIISTDGCLEEYRKCVQQSRMRYKESIIKMNNDKLWLIAAKYGVIEVFQDNPDCLDDNVIMTAVSFGHLEVVNLLLERHAHTHKVLLEEACAQADFEMVCLLLDQMRDHTQELIFTCILTALPSCNKDLIARLLTYIPERELSIDYKTRLLCSAVECRNNIPLSLILAKFRIDAEFISEFKDGNLLRTALQAGSIECCKLLLKMYPQLAKLNLLDQTELKQLPSIANLLSKLSLKDNLISS